MRFSTGPGKGLLRCQNVLINAESSSLPLADDLNSHIRDLYSKAIQDIKCNLDEIKCASQEKCILISNFQDGVKDCDDGSDEICYDWQFDCGWGNPKCILKEQINDGKIDCVGGLDENCGWDDYMCYDKKKCVPLAKYQDGIMDCEDQSDEICQLNQFQCGSPRKCISLSKVGDGAKDCLDGSDEREDLNLTLNPDQDYDLIPDLSTVPKKSEQRTVTSSSKSTITSFKPLLPVSPKPKKVIDPINALIDGSKKSTTEKASSSKYPITTPNKSPKDNRHATTPPLGIYKLPKCNLNNQGIQCDTNAVCQISETGLPECICQDGFIFMTDGMDELLGEGCLEATSHQIILRLLKMDDKYLKFIDSYNDPSSNEYRKLSRAVRKGLKQVFNKSRISRKILDIRINGVLGFLNEFDEEGPPGITLNCTLYTHKRYLVNEIEIHNSLVSSLLSTNFRLGESTITLDTDYEYITNYNSLVRKSRPKMEDKNDILNRDIVNSINDRVSEVLSTSKMAATTRQLPTVTSITILRKPRRSASRTAELQVAG
ncbi:transmembrane cell adhesion receptor mua-3-like [Gordionus sp. m RMFG-2023]|uniref:transmembrane cell adhesion receptor mua-3-like n=1 Tax=Gordionus sp. m RMFG-2023 TaxID=3053472 RepID=UPI0031FE318D